MISFWFFDDKKVKNIENDYIITHIFYLLLEIKPRNFFNTYVDHIIFIVDFQ